MTPPTIAMVITTLDVGGAQETVAALVEGLDDDHRIVVFSGPEQQEQIVARLRMTAATLVTVAPLVRPIAPMRDIAAVVRLAVELRRLRPDVVHTHSSKAGVVGRLAALMARVPIVVHTVHGWSFHGTMPMGTRVLFLAMERLLARVTTALVVVATADQEKGLASGVGRRRQYRLIRSGVDVRSSIPSDGDRRARRAALGVADGQVVVGTVTRFSDQKDPIAWLRAANEIHAARPTARFVVIGGGPIQAEVEAAVSELGLDHVVQLLGRRSDARDLLAAFDVFLMSSRWEGLPRAILEAMAAKVPVVATAVDGVPEVVIDGATGRLAPPGDWQALASCVLDLLDHPDDARSMARAASERLLEFDESTMVRRTRELYRELVGEVAHRR